MNERNRVFLRDEVVTQLAVSSVPAAKLHVLGLAPLKSKLGAKWERLSVLVHKLFEKAIANAQGPSDRFVVLDELSYVVTFSNLSLGETRVICAAIAREVCEHLFGDQIDEISVRSIVAEIIAPSSIDDIHAGAQIEAMLERHGIETVITQSAQSGSPKPVTSVAENRPGSPLSPIERIQQVHSLVAQFGLTLGLFPIWELRRGISSALFLTPFSESATNLIVLGKCSLSGITETQIIDMEVNQLNAAEAYATRVHGNGAICAISVGVTYDSLCCFRSRIRYITALQKTSFSASNPLLIKIEQIPDGAPDGRIAELIAMLSAQNIRVTLEFRSLLSIPQFGIRLGAAALGGTLPSNLDDVAAMAIADKLVGRATAQKAFAFLDHLDTPERVALANQSGVRFGTGTALSTRHFSGFENLPTFPLTFAHSG